MHITVKHWSNLMNLDWVPDGKGLFMSAIQPSCVLLHVDLHGNAKVLWEPQGAQMIWALPSPDGHHIAMPFHGESVNAWMIENF
jgi:hypothetical protein